MLFLFEVAVLGCFLGSIRMGFIIMLLIVIFIFRDSRRDSSWYRRLIYECEKNDCVFEGLGLVKFCSFILIFCFSY